MTYEQVLQNIENGNNGEMDEFCAISSPLAKIENEDIGTPNYGVSVIIKVEGGFLVRVYDEKGDSEDFATTEIDMAMKIATDELYRVTTEYD